MTDNVEHGQLSSDAGGGLGMHSLRLDRRRIVLLAGLGLLTVALLITLGGGRSALTALVHANWQIVALAVLVHYSGFAVRGWRWQLVLRTMGHRLPYLYTTAVLLAGWFISALLPARAGDLFRIAILRLPSADRPAVPVPDSLGSIVLERGLDILAILLLGAGFGYLMLRGQAPSWVQLAYGGAVFVLVLAGLALFIAPALLAWLGRRSDRRWWQAALSFAQELVGSMRRLPAHPALAAVIVGQSLTIWFCDALLLWLVGRSLGQMWTLPGAAFTALTVDVIAAVPLTPGGLGQIEAAYAALLTLLSGQAASIAAVVLVTRAISYWSFLLFSGLVTFAAGFGQLLRK